MNKISTKNLFAVIAAFIWGTSFVAQKVNTLGSFTFNAFRSFTALLFIIPAILIQNKGDFRHIITEKDNTDTKRLIIGGILCGLALTVASFFQQFGIDSGTESGKAGFITTTYIVLVPVIGIFLKKKSNFLTWISVALAITGLYFLCIKEGFSLRPSDLYVLISAIFFAVHIHIIDRVSVGCNGLKLSLVQLLTVGFLSTICALIFEPITSKAISESIVSVLYVGIMSSGVAYTLQILAQKNSNPTVISILLSLESLFSVVAGAIILSEQLTFLEYLGCGLMFIAVILTQLPTKKKSVTKS